jgi:hypothetical protein
MSAPLPYKTPAEVARIFGCTVAQARGQLERNRAQLLGMLSHMRQRGLATYRGYTDARLCERIQAINLVLV